MTLFPVGQGTFERMYLKNARASLSIDGELDLYDTTRDIRSLALALALRHGRVKTPEA